MFCESEEEGEEEELMKKGKEGPNLSKDDRKSLILLDKSREFDRQIQVLIVEILTFLFAFPISFCLKNERERGREEKRPV